MERRNFLAGVSAFAATGALAVTKLEAGNGAPGSRDDEKPKPIEPKMVGEFVGKSHGNLDAVKALIKKEPRLAHAAWDWGGGDWETGLGAASHVGSRPVAEFLLDNNARVDGFAVAMLGLTDVLKPMLAVMPKLHAVPGPHGISMIVHAIYGGEKAKDTFELLLDAGADVNQAAYGGMTPLMAAAGTGRIELVEVLLDKGADHSLKDSAGKTALQWAEKREKKNVVDLLKKQK